MAHLTNIKEVKEYPQQFWGLFTRDKERTEGAYSYLVRVIGHGSLGNITDHIYYVQYTKYVVMIDPYYMGKISTLGAEHPLHFNKFNKDREGATLKRITRAQLRLLRLKFATNDL